jgi:peptidoglycan hydrolase-like protein with peptidoglycan-binding domain
MRKAPFAIVAMALLAGCSHTPAESSGSNTSTNTSQMSGSSMPPSHTQAAHTQAGRTQTAAATQPVLHISKDTVREVQGKLKAQGFDPGPEDGIMGPKTRQALADYQVKKGLPRTAELDDVTLRDITGSAPAESGSSTAPATGSNQPANAPASGSSGQPPNNASNPPTTQQSQ